jgi:hypothetical protein
MHSAHRSFFWLVCMLTSILSITAQQSCPAGKTDVGGICVDCVEGTYKLVSGTAACTLCQAGKFSTERGLSTTCENCPAGQYSAAGALVCTYCDAGKFQSTLGSSVCINCAAGRNSLAGASACALRTPTIFSCREATCSRWGSCDCGNACGATGQNTPCYLCPDGKYSNGNDVCYTCSVNSWNTQGLIDGSGWHSCNQCRPGWGAPSWHLSCAVCNVGEYSEGQPDNDWSGSSGPTKTRCYNCPAGSSTTATASPSRTSCVCNQGYTGPNGGPCNMCASGKYKEVSGIVACTQCPLLSTSPKGSTSITSCTCNSGYLKDTSTTPFTCQPPPCPAGSTGPAGSCTLCNAGKYKAVTGIASCDNCAAGKFSAATGQSSSATCQNCLAGKYASLTGSSVCENCFAGKFSALTGQSSSSTCQNCDAGKFSTATGQSSSATCQNCQAGTYGNLTGSTACTLCPVLTTSAAGSSIVTQCTCDSGYVGPNGGPCIACVLGTCLNTSCQDCLAGTYARLTGSSVCENCLAGKYSTATGQSSSGTCQNCSAGKFSDKVGQNSSGTCENCVAGKYSIATGQRFLVMRAQAIQPLLLGARKTQAVSATEVTVVPMLARVTHAPQASTRTR